MAETTEKILLQLELDVSQTLTNLEKAKAALSAFKKEQEQINSELKRLEETGQKGSVAFQNLERQLIANKAAQQNATTEIRNYEKQLRLAVAANEAQVGSIDQLKSQLSILTAEWNKLGEENRQNTEDGKNLQRAIQETTDKLNEQEQSVDNFRRQVGNYEVATKGLTQQIREATREATAISRQFGENSTQAVKAAQKVADLKEEYEDFNKRVAALNPEQKFAAFAQVASGVAGGFAAAEGALALFGEQSQGVAQALLKVQGALAFAQGLKQVAELGDSLKNLRLIIFGVTAAKQTDTAVTEANAAANVQGAAAAETLAAGEATATVATGGLSLAIRALLVGSGLILLPLAVSAVTEAFNAFGDHSQESIEQVTAALESESAAHKKNLEEIKAATSAQATELENALALAKAKGASVVEITEKEKQLRQVKLDGLTNERVENAQHLDELLRQQEQFTNEKLENLSKDELKAAQEKQKANEDEIRATRLKNAEILDEEKKLQTELITIDIDAEQKRRNEENQLANLRISLIQNEHKREIEQIKQAGQEKIDAIREDEANSAERRTLIAQETEQKIAEAERTFHLKTLQEKNQLTIALTREGTLERIDAQITAAQNERTELLKNTHLTETQKQLIIADSQNKIRELEEQRLQVVEQNNLKEVELSQRKAQAEIDAQKATATVGNDPALLLAARLNEINIQTQAAIDAKEREADELKAAAQREITDHEALQQRIKEIDETIAAEKLAITKQSVLDIAQTTQEANDERLQKLIEQHQLEIQASDQTEEFAAKLQLLKAQEELELNAVGITEERKDLIRKKFAKQEKELIEQQANTAINSASNTLGALSSIFKKQTAAYKIFATSQAIVDTYASAVAAYKAVAGVPIVGPALAVAAAAAAIGAGFANIAKINEVGGFYGGGYTGDGSPTEVSMSVGPKPYTYHKREYVIDHSTLALPHIASFVSDVVEPARLRRTPFTNRTSYATGGFAENLISQGGEVSQLVVAELRALREDIANQPPPVVTVEDINTGQKRVATVTDRANI